MRSCHSARMPTTRRCQASWPTSTTREPCAAAGTGVTAFALPLWTTRPTPSLRLSAWSPTGRETARLQSTDWQGCSNAIWVRRLALRHSSPVTTPESNSNHKRRASSRPPQGSLRRSLFWHSPRLKLSTVYRPSWKRMRSRLLPRRASLRIDVGLLSFRRLICAQKHSKPPTTGTSLTDNATTPSSERKPAGKSTPTIIGRLWGRQSDTANRRFVHCRRSWQDS